VVGARAGAGGELAGNMGRQETGTLMALVDRRILE